MTKSKFARAAFVFVSSCLLVVSVTGWAVSEHYLGGLSRVNVFGDLGGGVGWRGDPLNILVVGSDDRTGLSIKKRNHLRTGNLDYGRHTDTMLLVHLGADLERVSVVSIPRDSLVDIPEHVDGQGSTIPAHKGKINSAFGTGGPAVTVATVQAATGVDINHYIEVNFAGFLDIVNAVGGVPVCEPEPLSDYNSGLDLPAGRQTIKGKQALAYVRARYIDNDFGRAKRQQKFIAGLAQKVKADEVLRNPLTLNSLVDATVSAVTTDERLGRDDIAALSARLAGLDLSNINFTTIPVSNGSHPHNGESTVLWDDQAAPALFAALREDQPLPKPPKSVPVEVAPGQISVAIGGTEEQRSGFVGAGYQVQDGTLPAASGETTVEYDPAWTNSLATVQASLPNATYTPIPDKGPVFTIALGAGYSGLQPVRAMSTSVEQEVLSAQADICE